MRSKDYVVEKVGRLGSYTPPTLRFFVTALRALDYTFDLFNVVVPDCHRVYVCLMQSNLPDYVLDVASVLNVVVHPYPFVDDYDELRVWLIKYVYSLPYTITHYE